MLSDVISSLKFISSALGKLDAEQAAFFKAHIEPLHKRLHESHADYVTGFQEFRALLSADAQPRAEMIAWLKERRRDYVAQRDLTVKTAQAIEDDANANRIGATARLIAQYANSVAAYYSISNSVGGTSWYTHLIDSVERRVADDLFDGWDLRSISTNVRQSLLKEIDRNLDKFMPEALDKADTLYAELRMKML